MLMFSCRLLVGLVDLHREVDHVAGVGPESALLLLGHDARRPDAGLFLGGLHCPLVFVRGRGDELGSVWSLRKSGVGPF